MFVVVAEVLGLTARLATATTRVPEAKSPSRVACASAGTVAQRARTASGAPLADQQPALLVCRRGPRRAVARGRTGRRSSGGRSGCRWRTSRGVAQSARSSSLPVLSLQARPSTRTWSSGLPSVVERLREGNLTFGQGAGLVREQHLDVAQVLDATRRLTITRFLASRRAPVARLTVTIAGNSCGVSPTAIASAKRADWSIERPSAALIDEDRAGQQQLSQSRAAERSPAAPAGTRSPLAARPAAPRSSRRLCASPCERRRRAHRRRGRACP